MSYPRHYVTYAVTSEEAGSSPFWHSILLTSKQNHANEPIKVTDAIGFYSQPSSTTNPIIASLKRLLGFKVDLQDGHGELKKEEMRWLDTLGLYGISFEVDEEKYNRLQSCYTKAMKDEAAAIQEINASLIAKGLPINGYRRYIEECSKAQEKALEPRLKRFHVTMSFSFNSENSYTCKTRGLDFLTEARIIDDTMRQKLTGNKTLFAFPRYPQSPLRQIQLVSTGSPESHTSKRSGKTHYSRSWERGNQLFWTRDPMAYATHLSKVKFRCQESNDLAIKNILFHTRAMERLLLKKISVHNNMSQGDEAYFSELKQQLKRVQSIYDLFRATSNNQGDLTVKANLLFAESILNVAKISLTPKTINYSFILRAFNSISLRYALLGLIFIPISATIFTGLVSVTTTVAATLFATKMLTDYVQNAFKEAAMRQDYLAYVRSKSKPSHANESLALSPLSDSRYSFMQKSQKPTTVIEQVRNKLHLLKPNLEIADAFLNTF